MFKKLVYKLCKVIISSFTAILFSFNANAQNLALNKPYSVSTAPNYLHSAPSSDKASLTDGLFTRDKYFWNQTSTVGWQSKEVTVTIDLGKVAPISEVSISTFRSVDAGIFYPQNLFVFISSDGKKYNYLGDAADVLDNVSGKGQSKKFGLKEINEYARFVTVVLIPQGYFIFCDEIEVNRSAKTSKHSVQTISIDSLSQFVDSLKTPKYSRRGLSSLNSSLLTHKNQIDSQQINSDLEKSTSSLDLNLVSEEIGKQYALSIKDKFQTSFVIEKCNPWENTTEYRMPLLDESVINYQFQIQKGLAQYGAFLVTNVLGNDAKFSIDISNFNGTKIELFKIPFVPLSYFKTIRDPLIKVVNDIIISPGATCMFIFKLVGNKTGEDSAIIKVTSLGKTRRINVNVKIIDLPNLDKSQNLNTNVWAYFNTPMLKGNEENVSQDLYSHHINTFVIPPSRLTNFQKNNDQLFINYTNIFKKAKNVLLYMDYSSPSQRNGYPGGQFMSETWKNYFIAWYSKTIGFIKISQTSPQQIYLYPYDEIKDVDIEDFKKLIVWAKSAIPEIKFYATLGTEKAISEILPLLDLAQVHSTISDKNNLPVNSSQIWTYNGSSPSRDLSPYSFYRLMSWNAFLNDYKGIGFWNYADERNGGKLNLISGSSFNLAGSYSVIYNNPDGSIISSRRWEAFRLGIEDYSILQVYSKKFGIDKAKALSTQVIKQPNNLNLADSIRVNMIKAITGIE